MAQRDDAKVTEAIGHMVRRGELMFVFDVDDKAEIDGEPCDKWLKPDFVEAGYGVNTPCVIRFPDGRLELGNRFAFTAEGLSVLKVEMEAGRF